MGRISMPQGKGSQLHNRRDYEKIGREIPDNIDLSKTKDNIIIIDTDLKKAYQNIFGDAVQRYNNKQKRAERKITNYYDKIEHSKNGEKLFYEDVLQWGKKEDFESNPKMKQKATEALKKYTENFQKRNPNLKLIGAYIHLDEASPHLHLDYIPVAHNYSRGLDTRNSLDKALEEMGIEIKNRTKKVKDKDTQEEKEINLKEGRYNNRTMAWKEREREYFAEICQELGLEVESERHLGRKQLTVEEYKEAEKAMVEPIQQQAKFWEGQSDIYMDKALKNRDEANALSERSKQLKEQIEGQNTTIAVNAAEMTKQAERIADNKKTIQNMDDITRKLTYKDNKTVKAVNYTIPEQKSFLGQIREPERVGVFVEGLNRDDIKALVQRKNFNEGLEKSYENMRIKATDLVTKAQNEAKSIRDEATAERNDKIAKADQIVTHQADILQKAKDWADGLRKKYNDLLNKIDELIGKKDTLEKEIAVIENSRDKLEPLRKEVEDLTRAKKILTGELDCELTQAKFMTTDEFKTDRMWTLRDKGKLLALYNDGHTRVVGTNSTGGLDDQTLYDRKMGLCKVGAFIDEERVKVPRSVLKELIQARDIDKPISQNLDNLIKQQRDVERVVKSRGLTL